MNSSFKVDEEKLVSLSASGFESYLSEFVEYLNSFNNNIPPSKLLTGGNPRNQFYFDSFCIMVKRKYFPCEVIIKMLKNISIEMSSEVQFEMIKSVNSVKFQGQKHLPKPQSESLTLILDYILRSLVNYQEYSTLSRIIDLIPMIRRIIFEDHLKVLLSSFCSFIQLISCNQNSDTVIAKAALLLDTNSKKISMEPLPLPSFPHFKLMNVSEEVKIVSDAYYIQHILGICILENISEQSTSSDHLEKSVIMNNNNKDMMIKDFLVLVICFGCRYHKHKDLQLEAFQFLYFPSFY